MNPLNHLQIRDLRAALGLNQADFGRLIGCTQPEISRLEAGGPISRKTRAALVLLQWLEETGEPIPTNLEE